MEISEHRKYSHDFIALSYFIVHNKLSVVLPLIVLGILNYLEKQRLIMSKPLIVFHYAFWSVLGQQQMYFIWAMDIWVDTHKIGPFGPISYSKFRQYYRCLRWVGEMESNNKSNI